MHAPQAKIFNISDGVLQDAETILSSHKQAERWYRSVLEQRNK
jgi:hypothetical protein